MRWNKIGFTPLNSFMKRGTRERDFKIVLLRFYIQGLRVNLPLFIPLLLLPLLFPPPLILPPLPLPLPPPLSLTLPPPPISFTEEEHSSFSSPTPSSPHATSPATHSTSLPPARCLATSFSGEGPWRLSTPRNRSL